ncbi:MAG: J domain-containing protein [Lachnospiraceae bacterium]|nr:J domain-containing protein [Lachnospiraceae bacterium]
MEVKKFDVFEGIIIGFVAFSYIRSAFSNAGIFPCILFGIGIAAIFLIFYHEKYIGVILNIAACVFWSVFFTSIISLFSFFIGKPALLIVIGAAIFYGSLYLHGLKPVDLINKIKELIKKIIKRIRKFKTSDPSIKAIITEYDDEYERLIQLKEFITPHINSALSDPTLGDRIRNEAKLHRDSMESAINTYEKTSVIVKKRKITSVELETLKANLLQLKDINATISMLVVAAREGEERRRQEKINRERQSQQEQQKSSFSYFNGCDSKESITKRYRALCKAFHPDMGNGSPEDFSRLTDEYNELLKWYQ